MKKILLIFLALAISIIFPSSNDGTGMIEVDIGRNYPTGIFDKYTDDGTSLRFSYSKSFKDNYLFKWQAGFQYISFRTDRYTDQFVMGSGNEGPPVNVTNSEDGYIGNAGFRFTAQKGLSNKGLFRPYIGASVGFAAFRETTRWKWDSGYWSNNDCVNPGFVNIILSILTEDFNLCDDNDGMHRVNDSRTEPVFTLDLGTNIFFNTSHNVGLDIGVRYNMITGLKKPQTVYDYTNNAHEYITKKLQADYYTLYIGVSIAMNSEKKETKEEPIRF